MREIKFRGKSIKTGKWVYGYYVLSNGSLIHEGNYGGIWTVDPETVSQLIGLKDKNGVDIFEGDIVKMVFPGIKGPRVVEFLNGAFGVKSQSESEDIWWAEVWHMDVEVIGNIYENPELLPED